MTTTIEKLNAKLATMPVEQLREFAANVVRILYLDWNEEGDADCLDSEKEWTHDAIERIADECDAAGLHPAKL